MKELRDLKDLTIHDIGTRGRVDGLRLSQYSRIVREIGSDPTENTKPETRNQKPFPMKTRLNPIPCIVKVLGIQPRVG